VSPGSRRHPEGPLPDGPAPEGPAPGGPTPGGPTPSGLSSGDSDGLGSVSTKVVRVRVFIDGRVQGVGYRATAAQEAVRLGIAGWVRNLYDGRVEAVYEGPRAAVEEMIAWTRRGPAGSWVTKMSIHDEAPKGERGFSVL
jgi:acylphosphatase